MKQSKAHFIIKTRFIIKNKTMRTIKTLLLVASTAAFLSFVAKGKQHTIFIR
jgi:hypothetical protein